MHPAIHVSDPQDIEAPILLRSAESTQTKRQSGHAASGECASSIVAIKHTIAEHAVIAQDINPGKFVDFAI